MWVNVTRGESVFDKSSDEKMSEMTCDEYPVRTKQKNRAGKRRAEDFNKRIKQKIYWNKFAQNFANLLKNTFFVLFFILHRPAVRISLPFRDIHYSPARFAINVFLVMFIYILFLLYHIGSFYWPLCMHCLSRYEALGKFRVHSNEVAKRSPISWNSTWEPRKFVGSRGYFDMMEPRGPRPCGLLPRLWLLLILNSQEWSTSIFFLNINT